MNLTRLQPRPAGYCSHTRKMQAQAAVVGGGTTTTAKSGVERAENAQSGAITRLLRPTNRACETVCPFLAKTRFTSPHYTASR